MSSEFFKSLSFTALFLAPFAAPAQVTSGQSFRLASACDTSKVMSIASNSLLDNARAVLQTENLSNNSQVFKFETYSSGYKITNLASGKTLNIANASTASNAALEQYKFTGVPSEVFKVSTTSDGYYRLQNSNSSLYVNLVKAVTTDGNPFEQWLDSTACAEKFKLIAVASTTPTTTTTTTTMPPVTTTTLPAPASGTRDPLKQPFASTSIWNMPIGSGAQFAPANFLENSNPGNANIWAAFPGIDHEHIVMTPTAPMTSVYYSSAAWTGANRCGATGALQTQVPMPGDYLVANSGGNEMASFLMPDKRSIVEMQPLARCNVGGYATSYAFWSPTDIYGDGRLGAHGGSGLSGVGGSLRMGELRPGQQGPRHALKFTVYGAAVLYNCSVRTDCFRWPAATADSVALTTYGTANNNQNTQMKMGALLAIPGSVSMSSLGLETEPGRQLFFTLQNYGAYIVDIGAPGIYISIEDGTAGNKSVEFQNDYGYAFVQKVVSPNPWFRDMQRLAKALMVVTNNTQNSIGGGGTPRQPLAPAIAP